MRHKNYILFIFLLLLCPTILLTADHWLYTHLQHHIDRQLRKLTQQAAQHHLEFTFSSAETGGWPWGATRTLLLPQLHYQDDKLAYNVATLQLHLGGNWREWLWRKLTHQGMPVHLPQRTILHLTYQGQTVTLESLDSTLHFSHEASTKQHFNVVLDTAFMACILPQTETKLILKQLQGKLVLTPSASETESLFNTQLTARTASLYLPHHTALPLLAHPHMALALLGASLPTQKTHKLLLHDLSFDLPTADLFNPAETPQATHLHLALGGNIYLPNGNGKVSLHLYHWRTGLFSALNMPVFQNYLTPNIRNTLIQQLHLSAHAEPSLEEHPLSLNIPIIQGALNGISSEQWEHFYNMLLFSSPFKLGTGL